MNEFWLCFVPLFVAVDAIGNIPIFLGLTHGITGAPLRRLVVQSVITAAAVGLAFLAGGAVLLRMLGITVADFMVAGGILLFVISMGDILSSQKSEEQGDPDTLGAVPIGVPLITGPAVLTTSLLLNSQYGVIMPAITLVINILIVGLAFIFAPNINKVLGKAGSKTISKIASLLLAAIAVMIVRKGITSFFS